MINRSVLKGRGKAAFLSNYWKCVLVALVAALFLGSALSQRNNAPSQSTQYNSANSQYFTEDTAKYALVLIPGLITIGLAAGATGTLVKIFLVAPLEIGCDSFFTQNARGQGDLGELLTGFRGDYLRNVLTMFLRDLFIALWTLLLIFPGIMKAYSYRLIPYILADSPELSRREVMALSCQLMDGHRWEAFVLDLSFFGWQLLNVCTVGILGIFYVNPYVRATDAELYLSLRF